MLDAEDALRQRIGRVVVGHHHCALHDDRPGVGFGDHEVHGRARDLDPGLQRLAVRIEARKGRQQRGMDIEHLAVPAPYELGREEPHESAQTNQLDAVLRRLVEAGARVVTHVFTHFPLELAVYTAKVPARTRAPRGMRWVPIATLADEALPNVMRKAIAHGLGE